MRVGFDVISDLNLDPNDSFNWENKPSSLYCIVNGNVSSNMEIVRQTLLHLSGLYQGVLYLPSSLEYSNVYNIKQVNQDIRRICRGISNAVFLHNHVIIIDHVAILGVSGWYNNVVTNNDVIKHAIAQKHRDSDLEYLKNTLVKVTFHDEIKKAVLVSGCVPDQQLYFGKVPDLVLDELDLSITLGYDADSKVTHWLYGNNDVLADVKIGNVNYVNNAYMGRKPYWPKRIEVEV